jgi:chromosome segregation ATPase
MDNRSNVFHKEVGILEDVKKNITNANLSKKELETSYQELSIHFEKLLKDTKVLTSVSDRLHHKVNDVNTKLQTQSDEIQEINTELNINNQALKDTVEMLMKAKVSQKASSIVLLIAILLFVASEVFIEPIIEQNTSSEYIGLLLKGMIALLLKPIDILVERLLMRRAIKSVNEESNSLAKKYT